MLSEFIFPSSEQHLHMENDIILSFGKLEVVPFYSAVKTNFLQFIKKVRKQYTLNKCRFWGSFLGDGRKWCYWSGLWGVKSI